MNYYKSRVMVSLEGKCPMGCRHCFTYELPGGADCNKDISQSRLYADSKEVVDNMDQRNEAEHAIERLKGRDFDIIYLSETNENFFDEDKGLQLCRKLYARYEKDIFIITRMQLSDMVLDALGALNSHMSVNGHRLYLAVSCIGGKSYGISENSSICPPPESRLANLKKASKSGIDTLLLLRPVFPDNIIPISECTELIAAASPYIDAVVSSGLIVTDGILNRLGFSETDFTYIEHGDSDYLENLPKDRAKFLDVEEELNVLKSFCAEISMPFFKHSMPALNYIANTGMHMEHSI